MRFDVEINGRTRRVVVARTSGGFDVAVDGRTFQVDAVRIDGQTLSLLVRAPLEPVVVSGLSRTGDVSGSSRTDEGTGSIRSFEVTVVPDAASAALAVHVGTTGLVAAINGRRRWGRREDEAHAGTGPQRIVAPMPGKIVRVLVKSGEAVRARQAVVVVEAMKMENELRAGRDGTVAEIRAQEGASVDAGALLVVIQ